MRAMPRLHRFAVGDRHFALDPETCFCFECDAISWDVLQHYPHEPVNRIFHLLESRYDRRELAEVVGELEWLRATKSILPAPKKDDGQALLPPDKGLRELTVQCTTPGSACIEPRIADSAVDLLFFRAVKDRPLRLALRINGNADISDTVSAFAARAWERARLAGKELTVVLAVETPEITRIPETLAQHALRVELSASTPEAFQHIVKQQTHHRSQSLKNWGRALADPGPAIAGRFVITPQRPMFQTAIEALRDAAFPHITIDLDAALAADPARDPAEWFAELDAVARTYAADLLAHRYYRLDPVAYLFWRIYNCSPTTRSDLAGTHALYVDLSGAVYPTERLAFPEHQLGAVTAQGIDEQHRAAYDDVGVSVTPACMRCWARHLCGGGPVAVHAIRTGNFRVPDAAWCNAQRDWLEHAVAAFNVLSASGVPFDRVYHGLQQRGKVPLFAAAKAVFQMHVGLRPLQEADAPVLAQWESWNRAAYFLLSPRSVFIGNQYEREMDALHPRADEFELLLLHRNGTPAGLFKLQPDVKTGIADVFLYLHAPSDYASSRVRRGFREILRQTAGERSLRRLHVYAAPWEAPLQEFLAALGCRPLGNLSEAIYTQGRYHDAAVFELNVTA